MMDNDDRSCEELLDDLEYHVKRLMREHESNCFEVSEEAVTQYQCIMSKLKSAMHLLQTHYTHDIKLLAASQEAARMYIENSNLEADAKRYRKIVAHPHLALQYYVDGKWKDVELDSPRWDDTDFLHKTHDPIVDSYE